MTYGADASGLAAGQSYTAAAAAAAAAPIDVGSLSGARQKARGGQKTATRQKFGDAIIEAASAATKKKSSGAVSLKGLTIEGGARGRGASAGVAMKARRTKKVHDAAAEAGCPPLE